MKPIAGLHHVTAIVSDAQRTLDFYTQVLGLRLVKRTVNFDDPGSYHLYFGDDAGSPGTILTFFAWPGARRGTNGVGETLAVGFRVPPASLVFWQQHLATTAVVPEQSFRFGEPALSFSDPDGMVIEIVGSAAPGVVAADAGGVVPPRTPLIPAEHALRGFSGATLLEEGFERTEKLLTAMGFALATQEGMRYRFAAPGTAPGTHIDLLVAPHRTRGRMGSGTIHHIAFRIADDASQADWRGKLAALGMDVTPVMDRTYFHSVYFREPGGVLFELATDPPGFALDEPLETLGETLKLPPWLEGQRAAIEKHLPTLSLSAETADAR